MYFWGLQPPVRGLVSGRSVGKNVLQFYKLTYLFFGEYASPCNLRTTLWQKKLVQVQVEFFLVFFFNTLSSRHKQTQQLYQNRFYSRPCDLSDITTVRPGGCRAQPREYNIDEGKDRRQKSTNWYSHVPRLTSNNLFQI